MLRYLTIGSKETWSNLGPICLPMQETQETWVKSLGGEDPLEEEMATHSSILAWKIPYTKTGRATVHVVAKSWTQLSD